MVKLLGITSSSEDMERFTDAEELDFFLDQYGFEGVELMRVGTPDGGIVKPERSIGFHLRFFTCWMDFWTGNRAGILENFDSWENCVQFYGGEGRGAITDMFRDELAFAHKIGAKYVVLHVSHVNLTECVTYRFGYSDEEVIRSTCELVNELLPESADYSFELLLENLWWPGLTFTNPDMTRKLLDGIQYKKKGLLLDTGHLMNCNLNLKDEEDGIAFIHSMLDAHQDLAERIRAVHLHQSVSGKYVHEVLDALAKGEKSIVGEDFIKEGFAERFGDIYIHILNIDCHKPFTSTKVRALIDRIAPEYLVYEFITRSRDELTKFIETQDHALFD